MESKVTFDILVVDDEPPIYDLIVRTGRSVFPEATFVSTRTPQLTLNYLDGQLPKVPNLVLLDIDLNQATDGLELLPQLYRRFKGQVPVVMLTASVDQRAIFESYDRGAVAYTQKPDDLQGWKDYVTALRDFLFTMDRLRSPSLEER